MSTALLERETTSREITSRHLLRAAEIIEEEGARQVHHH